MTSTITERALQYVEEQQERFLDELKDLLRFPSVSAQSARFPDLLACALWLVDHLAGLGLEAALIETAGKPIVRARTPGAADKRLIVYGHYDVQPEDPLDEWNSPPFEPEVRDGFLYARGASDDKGQLFAHVKAVESLLKTGGELPCEVLFLLEGEEESGGHALPDFIRQEKANLNCEAVVVSDSSMYDEQTPALTYGLRGITGLELKLTGARCDLHSGGFGGAAPNPALALARMLGQCVDAAGRVLVPGFYDDVRPLADWERENIARLNHDEAALEREYGIPRLTGEAGYATLERIWARPTFEINGIYGGYQGEGPKTIIPSSATAKITMRLVPDQEPATIAAHARAHLEALCPDAVTLQIDGSFGGARPLLFDPQAPAMQAGLAALRAGFGAEPVFIRCGGSIPVVEIFWQELQRPVLLLGFGLESDGLHSPNERFKVSNFINGIKTSVQLIAGI